MTSFVENESERRTKEGSKLLFSGELVIEGGRVPVYIMELRREGCRGVVSADKIPSEATLRLPLPKREPIEVRARISWSKELSPQSWHVTFEEFEFANKAQERDLISYLNEILVESEELGVKALRALGNDELNRLSRFVKASRSLNPCQGYIEAIEQVVDVMRRSLGAERGLFLVDRGEDEMAVEVARGNAKERGLRFSTTVSRQVAESGKPLLSLDAQTDQALGAVTSIKMLGTVSVMCLPLGTQERRFGYVYLDNSMSRGLFRETDLALATIIADLATASLEKNWYHQEAIQGERVSANRNLTSVITRELHPHLNILSQIVERLPEGRETEQLQAKTRQCLEFLEKFNPTGKTGRTKEPVDLMDVIEEIALDVGDMVEFPLPPEKGWPKLSLDLEPLSQIMMDLIRAAKLDEESEVKVMVATQYNVLKITVHSPHLALSNIELSRVFHPLRGRGLSDTIRLIHEHRGLLRVNKDPAAGTVFTAEFPLNRS